MTIANDGNSTVALTLPSSLQYDFGSLSDLSLAAGESATFTVQPKVGLAIGNHAETITVTTDRSTSASVSAAFTVQAASYSITAEPFLITFPSAVQGAAPPAAKTVTITNTGNVAVTLTQPTATNYTVSAISALQLEPLETAVFDVQPKPGLAEGAYDETIAVPGSNGASAQVAVHFTVTAALSYAIEASPALITFDSLAEGYLPPEAKTVTVTNIGNQNVSLNQPTAAHYVISALSGTALIPGGSAQFTVVPKPGLTQGTWDETILILGSNGAQTQAEIAFTCTAPLKYQIISGDTSFEQGGSDDTTLTITGNGRIQDFMGLTLNGEVVDRSDYDLRSGSTIITLHHGFLAGLAPGEYTLRILYTDGYAQANFTVYGKMPVTGDNDTVIIYGILLTLSLAALAALSRKKQTAR